MNRLLSYRNVNPHDEVNMFALDDAYVNESVTGNSYGDLGVFVKISSADLNQSSPVSYGTNSYMGKTNYNHVYDNFWISNPMKVAPAASGDTLNVFGLTLEQTAKYDENNNKLFHDPIKKAENMAVLPGESVRIATHGTFEVSKYVFDGTLTPGSGFKLSATSGKITGCDLSDSARIGKVMATGSRTNSADAYSGNYAIINF